MRSVADKQDHQGETKTGELPVDCDYPRRELFDAHQRGRVHGPLLPDPAERGRDEQDLPVGHEPDVA